MTLDDLAEKYAALLLLKRERESAIAKGQSSFAEEERRARRQQMALLASRFPGALRELEVLEITRLEARQAAIEKARGGAAPERWMEVSLFFHEALVEALKVRRGEKSLFWSRHPEIVEELKRPRGGRLMPLVWRVVAATHSMSAREAELTLYPDSSQRAGVC